jgi:hypothetical protein
MDDFLFQKAGKYCEYFPANFKSVANRLSYNTNVNW